MYVESSDGATTMGAPANHGRVEFVVGSRLALWVFTRFSGFPPFPPSIKTNISKKVLLELSLLSNISLFREAHKRG